MSKSESIWRGWQDIYDKYSEKLEALGANIEYVKEKYGSIRFEVSNYNEEIANLILEAEEKSLETCQICGTEVNVRQIEIRRWIHTLCENCINDKLEGLKK